MAATRQPARHRTSSCGAPGRPALRAAPGAVVWWSLGRL